MKFCVRAVAALVLSSALLAQTGCRSAVTSETNGRHAWTRPHVLRLADISDPDTLNEYLSTMDLVYFLSSLMYSYLVVADDRGGLEGDLALQVPTLANHGISADGRTYTYHLRRGVRWQDGARLTSADVKFSWQAVVNPANNTLHREGYTEIASIETPDDYMVRVHLLRRYPPFVSKFFTSLQEGGKPILPAHLLARYPDINHVEFDAAPVGSGPFKFVRWDRGRELVLERNPLYFRGVPKLERVELHVIPDDQSILNEMRLHHIDLIASPSVTQYPVFRSMQDVVAQTGAWNSQELLVLNDSKPGLNDVRVRRAISMAVDYDAIITKLAHGTAEPARDFIPPTALGFANNPPYRYDPKAANAMLDAAGYKTGGDGVRANGRTRLEYTLSTISGNASLRSMAVLLQQYFRDVDVKLNIKLYPYNGLFTPDGPTYSGKYDFAMYGVTLTWDPDMSFYLGCKSFYPSGENIYRYCNPAADRLEAAGLNTDDPGRRARIYRAAETIFWHDVPYIPLYERRRIVIRSPDLRNFRLNPSSTPWYHVWDWDI